MEWVSAIYVPSRSNRKTQQNAMSVGPYQTSKRFDGIAQRVTTLAFMNLLPYFTCLLQRRIGLRPQMKVMPLFAYFQGGSRQRLKRENANAQYSVKRVRISQSASPVLALVGNFSSAFPLAPSAIYHQQKISLRHTRAKSTATAAAAAAAMLL